MWLKQQADGFKMSNIECWVVFVVMQKKKSRSGITEPLLKKDCD